MKDPTELSASCLPSTRRQMVTRAAFAFGGLLAANALAEALTAQTKAAAAADPNRLTLHYEAGFKVAPRRIYETLLDSKQFSALTGLPAQIDPTAGGQFSMFSGMITGRNIELVPDARIVQAWRPGHWTPGVYSIVKFELKPRGSESTLVLDHTGFPLGDADGLDSGWHEHYLDRMTKYFAA